MKPYYKIFLLLLLLSTKCFSDQLIIEPDMGRAPILTSIKNAHSIELVIYGLTDPTFIQALINTKNIRILLEKTPYKADDENQMAIHLFQQYKINLHWPNPQFKLTHQKTFIFNGQSALIMTCNLTRSTFSKERNFALLTNDTKITNEIKRVFDADWQHQNITVKNPNLIWCPNNCREKMIHFITNAHHEIKIYAEDISDYEVIGKLAQMARSGVKVKLLLSEFDKSLKNQKRFLYLTRAGVEIHFNQQYIIHAKVIIIDQQHALIGSTNLTQASMNDNRELSIITSDKNVLQPLLDTFNKDWVN